MSFLNDAPTTWALIPAAGIGSRMQSEIPKQYLEIDGKTILEHSISKFLEHSQIHKIVVVIHPEDKRFLDLPLAKDPKILVVSGGDERANSVLNGLQAIISVGGPNDWVMVHDAARPCLAPQHIDHLLLARDSSPEGAILAVPTVDTVKVTNAKQTIDKTLDRETIWLAQTPQFFPVERLSQAIEQGLQQNLNITDEASAIEAQGASPALITGSRKNIKITEPEDLFLASIWLNHH